MKLPGIKKLRLKIHSAECLRSFNLIVLFHEISVSIHYRDIGFGSPNLHVEKIFCIFCFCVITSSRMATLTKVYSWYVCPRKIANCYVEDSLGANGNVLSV